jgi:hypothetical protein
MVGQHEGVGLGRKQGFFLQTMRSLDIFQILKEKLEKACVVLIWCVLVS